MHVHWAGNNHHYHLLTRLPLEPPPLVHLKPTDNGRALSWANKYLNRIQSCWTSSSSGEHCICMYIVAVGCTASLKEAQQWTQFKGGWETVWVCVCQEVSAVINKPARLPPIQWVLTMSLVSWNRIPIFMFPQSCLEQCTCGLVKKPPQEHEQLLLVISSISVSERVNERLTCSWCCRCSCWETI